MHPAVHLSRFSKSPCAQAAFRGLLALLISVPVLHAMGQGSAPGAAPATVSSTAPSAINASALADALSALQSTFPEVTDAVNNVELHKWKVPGDVKSTASSDIQSIVRDLNGTLPQLVGQAQAAPATIAPAFAVYRNLDALYDVLLRITETATLAGSQQEAARLEKARADLQTRRSQLGNAILNSATAQDSSIVQLQATAAGVRQNTSTPSAFPKKTVVNDGPDVPPAKAVRKKKPAAPPASPQQ